MRMLLSIVAIFIGSFSSVFALIETTDKKIASTVTSTHLLNWSAGLVFVLALFFACIWFMRKMGALPNSSDSPMRIVGALSLGVREKLVLVQVGEKQLLLGITPGRMVNLLVLEGAEQIFKEKRLEPEEGEFSKKLKQLLAGSSSE